MLDDTTHRGLGIVSETKSYSTKQVLKEEIDDEYRTTLINFAKYHLIMFTMAKLWKYKNLKEIKWLCIYLIV